MKIIPEPFRFSLRTLLIVVTIFCVLLGLLVPAFRSARDAARLMQLGNKFKQLSLGLHGYSAAYDQFPAANGIDLVGKPINSWRAWMGPFIEGSKTHFDSNVAWDAPINEPISLTPAEPEV